MMTILMEFLTVSASFRNQKKISLLLWPHLLRLLLPLLRRLLLLVLRRLLLLVLLTTTAATATAAAAMTTTTSSYCSSSIFISFACLPPFVSLCLLLLLLLLLPFPMPINLNLSPSSLTQVLLRTSPSHQLIRPQPRLRPLPPHRSPLDPPR